MELSINIDGKAISIDLDHIEGKDVQGIANVPSLHWYDMPDVFDRAKAVLELPSWDDLFQEVLKIEKRNPVMEQDWMQVAFDLGCLVAVSAIMDKGLDCTNIWGLIGEQDLLLRDGYSSVKAKRGIEGIIAVMKGFIASRLSANKTNED